MHLLLDSVHLVPHVASLAVTRRMRAQGWVRRDGVLWSPVRGYTAAKHARRRIAAAKPYALVADEYQAYCDWRAVHRNR